MIHKAKDLSPDQKRPSNDCWDVRLLKTKEISIHTIAPPPSPDWLKQSWESAKRQGIDQLSPEEVEAEIGAARRSRRERRTSDRWSALSWTRMF
jgi:hypothetical protein